MDILSIVVCTRNRPDSIGLTLQSLLAGKDERLELIVVDQGDPAPALSAFAADARLRYVRSKTVGKGAALNEGLRLATSDIVVFTDDDCEAPAGWPRAMARALAGQPATALVFCNIEAPPCDWTKGYVPHYHRDESRLLRTLLDTCAGHGMGAGMAMRRDIVLGMGGFDELVGPGARFPSGDDWDITHRLLLKGWRVYEAADISIVHHGFRTLEQGRAHAYRDWLAIGAVCAKPIRAGYLTAVALPIWYFSVHALWPPFRDLLRFEKPRGRSRIAGFLAGFVKGWRTPVDGTTLLFQPGGRRAEQTSLRPQAAENTSKVVNG